MFFLAYFYLTDISEAVSIDYYSSSNHVELACSISPALITDFTNMKRCLCNKSVMS